MLRFSCGRRTVSSLRLFQHFFTVKNVSETSLFTVLYLAHHVLLCYRWTLKADALAVRPRYISLTGGNY